MAITWKPKIDKLWARIGEEESRVQEATQPPAPEPPTGQPIDWSRIEGEATQTGIDWGRLSGSGGSIDWGRLGAPPTTAPKIPWYEKPQEYYSKPVAANIMMPIWAQLHPEDPGSRLFQEHLAETGGDPLAYMKGFLPGGKAREAYDIAEMPKYARGGAEIGVELPLWLAMPGAGVLRGGGLAAKAAGLAKGASAAEIAAKLALPAVSKTAKAARAARALLKPVAAMETAPVKLLQKLTKKQPITSLKVLGRVWDKSSTGDRAKLSKLAGVEGVGAWKALGRENQKALGSIFKQPLELVALSSKDPTIQPLIRKTISFMDAMRVARRKTDILTTVERGLRVGKAERAMERGLKAGKTAEEILKASKGKLKKPYPFEEFVAPEMIPSAPEIDKLQRIAMEIGKDYFDRMTVPESLAWLFQTGLQRPLTPSKLEAMARIFGSDFVNAVQPISRSKKVWNLFLDVANFPRALLTSFDLSVTLRQNLFELLAHPKRFPKLVSGQLRALISEEAMIKNRAGYLAREGIKETDDILRHAGIKLGHNEFIAPMPGTPEAVGYQAQEEFMSRFAQKVWGIKHSARAFIDGTTNMYTNSISEYWKLYKNVATKTDIVEYAKLVGNSIGRGSLGHMKFASPLLNATIFAPRYTASLFNLPHFLFSPSPLVRKEATKRLARLMIFGINTLRLAQLAGAEIGTNPLSSDFGKIKVGKVRFDYWRGYAQLSRFMAQLTAARRKSTSGKMYDTTRQQVIERFFQSKFSPGMGLLWDLLVGKTYMGEEVFPAEKEKLLERFRDRLAPLTIQDFVDALEEEGLPMAMAAGTAATFGVGVQTYTGLGKYEPDFKKTAFGETGFGQTQFGK